MPEISGAISGSGSSEVSAGSDLDLALENFSTLGDFRTSDRRFTALFPIQLRLRSVPKLKGLRCRKIIGAGDFRVASGNIRAPDISGLFPVNNHHRSVLIFEWT